MTSLYNIISTISPNQFNIIKTIEKGRLGTIKLAKCKITKKLYAIKISYLDFKDKYTKKKTFDLIKNEIDINLKIEHPNILKMHYFYKEDLKYCMVLEYATKGDLFMLITTNGKLEEKKAVKYVKQIIKAIKYLHLNNILHRDIKLENVLISNDGTLKLGDFGLSIEIEHGEVVYDMVGTVKSASPEILKKIGYYYPTDIWSTGVLIYELITCYSPFYDKNITITFNNITSVDYILLKSMSTEVKELLSSIFTIDQNRRATLGDIMKSKWLNKNFIN